MEIDCQNMVRPVMSIRGYNFIIDNLKFLGPTNGPELFRLAAGGAVAVG